MVDNPKDGSKFKEILRFSRILNDLTSFTDDQVSSITFWSILESEIGFDFKSKVGSISKVGPISKVSIALTDSIIV